MAAAITRTLRPEARLIGFDSEAVGIAVRRALGHASRWEDLTFDVIRPIKLDPKLHVALDEVIANRVARGQANPNLRFWDWDRPLVVIGSFQSYRNEIDDEGRAKHGIEVVRRITGGGAMFMEEGNCITYSLVVPGSLVEGLSYEQSYKFLDTWVIGALAEVGINAATSRSTTSPRTRARSVARPSVASSTAPSCTTPPAPTTSTPTRCSRCCGSVARS